MVAWMTLGAIFWLPNSLIADTSCSRESGDVSAPGRRLAVDERPPVGLRVAMLAHGQRVRLWLLRSYADGDVFFGVHNKGPFNRVDANRPVR